MSRFLVKYRKWLFALMTALAVAAALLVPQININTDMTRYLPDSYPMKQGLDVLEAELPALQGHMQDFGSVFANGQDLMPKDLPRTLAIGVALLFGVLLLMCTSLMEVPLFLLTTGFAVVINMGTNALLPSVSMLTNTLTPVLQMVLSMDYCIILMNRFRQEKALGKGLEPAMEGAIGSAASSILSSAFTTIVSLLMLCFIKLRIGADLGIVLAKGVAISMLCNFTVLPFLILAADRAVEATRKPVLRFPAAGVARFEQRFRWPLLVLFVGFFAACCYLRTLTPLTFEPQYQSNASAEKSDENILLLLYPTAQENTAATLLDSLSARADVHRTVSYPSLVLQPRTAPEMAALFRGLAPDRAFPEELLPLVYYARFRPQRTERLSFNELQDLADTLAARGLAPAGRLEAMMPPADPSSPSAPQDDSAILRETPVMLSDSEESPASAADSTEAASPSESAVIPGEAPAVIPVEASVSHSPVVVQQVPYTYEELTTPLTAAQQAAFLGGNPREVSMVYRMAGRKNQTMTPADFLRYSRDNILTNKRLSVFVSKAAAQELVHRCALVDSVLAAGPTPLPADPSSPNSAEDAAPSSDRKADSSGAASPSEPAYTPDEAPAVTPDKAPSVTPGEAPVILSVSEESRPSPLERLADMALSGGRYTSAQAYRALKAAGIPVTAAELDLLYLYAGAQRDYQPDWALSPAQLLDFLSDTLLVNPALAGFVPDSARVAVQGAREQLVSEVGQLRGPRYSAGVVMSGYPAESPASFAYLDTLRARADATFPEPHYWIGETEMYKEMSDGFPSELLLLTLLTVLSIFLIVACNFRSLLIPVPLVMTILSGVYVNVWASGLGGFAMYYLAYLIVQGILMGATIDYSILFVHYYLESRRSASVQASLETAYRDASHSILTSGLILVVVPFVMAFTMKDPMIAGILRSLGTGALAVVILMMLVLPGVLAALDPLIKRRYERP